MEQRLLTIKETCEYLGIKPTKCRQLVKGRNGFGVMIDNKWYADKKALDRWIENNRQ